MTPDDLRAWRRRLGLSQTALANRVPVHRRTVEDWERGVYPVPGYMLRVMRDLEREITHEGPPSR